MQNTCNKNSELPFKCHWVCVPLIGGSLILAFIFYLFYVGYIAIDTAIWISMGVFMIIAIYESFLFFSLTKFMGNEVNKNTRSS